MERENESCSLGHVGRMSSWAPDCPAGKPASLNPCLLLVQPLLPPLATPKETRQWQPMPSGFLNLFPFTLLTFLCIDPRGFFLKQIWMFYSFFSSIRGIKHLGIFGLFFGGCFPIVNLIRISCFVLFCFGTKFFHLSYLSSGISFVFPRTLKNPFQEIHSQWLRNLLQLGNPSW